MRFNLDTGIILGLVSGIRFGYRGARPALQTWIQQERELPWHHLLPFNEDEELGCCESVRGEVERILTFAHPEEQGRYARLQARLRLLPDHDDVGIRLNRNIQAVDRIFVTTGRLNDLQNVTTDAKLVRALHDPTIWVLPPRPLVGAGK